jgi:hypothetical protein
MKIFGERYIAVGVTDPEPGKELGVVVQVATLGNVILSEDAVRKLADDLLRNANYLWPLQKETA